MGEAEREGAGLQGQVFGTLDLHRRADPTYLPWVENASSGHGGHKFPLSFMKSNSTKLKRLKFLESSLTMISKNL